jgi:TonB family protein
MPDWKAWEGHLLDGKYPLERCVGGNEESAVFLTGFVSAAVTIRRAAPAQAAALVERWNQVRLLSHPHLLQIDTAGIAALGAESVAYVVMEHADENLGEILRDRSLTPEETRDMLIQVASALDYLHSRGLANRDLKASNIVALGDKVKISSESIGHGDPAADVHALGAILIHALTGRPEPVPYPDLDRAVNLPPLFTEIAKGCLNPDPELRWKPDRILAWLRAPRPVESAPPTPPARPARPVTKPKVPRLAVAGVLAAAVMVVAAGVTLRRTDAPRPAFAEPRLPAAPAAEGPSASPAPSPPPSIAPPVPAAATEAPKPVPPVPMNRKADSTRDRLAVEDGIAHRVTPDVPEKARQTLDGRPAVVVRVTVDPAGDVTDSKVERTFSPYFSKLALNAAKRWKFGPEERAASRQWLLRFVFTQTETQVVARKAAAE